MPDVGPNYTIERRRLELANLEHNQTIARGRSRLGEIEGQKRINLSKAELANEELDDEAQRIRANEESLVAKIAENEANLKLMVKGPPAASKEPTDG